MFTLALGAHPGPGPQNSRKQLCPSWGSSAFCGDAQTTLPAAGTPRLLCPLRVRPDVCPGPQKLSEAALPFLGKLCLLRGRPDNSARCGYAQTTLPSSGQAGSLPSAGRAGPLHSAGTAGSVPTPGRADTRRGVFSVRTRTSAGRGRLLMHFRRHRPADHGTCSRSRRKPKSARKTDPTGNPTQTGKLSRPGPRPGPCPRPTPRPTARPTSRPRPTPSPRPG